MTETPAPASPTDDFEQRAFRLAKRAKLLAAGGEAYPVSVGRTTGLADLRARYGELEPDTRTGETVTVVGRVMFVRLAGKLCFATLQEGFSVAGDVAQLQAMLSLAEVGAEPLQAFKDLVDLGDQVAVTGEVITSRRGELSVLATSWQMAAKSLRPLPVAHKELSEESRVRQRYVDLLLRPAARDAVRARSAAVASLRESFAARDFLEVETPMLQARHGGAAARPFVTHINAYDLELYLRIAPELYLKRCVVGGLERVFEINRNFRNEGADATHSPEFTMLEAYQAHGDYDTMATLTRELVQGACRRLHGSEVARHADGTEFDLSGEWASTTLFGSLSQALGQEVTVDTPREHLVALAESRGVGVAPHFGPGKLAEELFEELVVPTLVAPIFVRDYPEETSPLTRAHRSTPGLTEKWDLYVEGTEVATAYSELVDPVVQRERFEAQVALSARGDDEAMVLDEDFLAAMEHGMPPAGGMGMGVDRLLRVLTGRTGIRETILFPFVKPLR